MIRKAEDGEGLERSDILRRMNEEQLMEVATQLLCLGREAPNAIFNETCERDIAEVADEMVRRGTWLVEEELGWL